jgi:dynein heavy chain
MSIKKSIALFEETLDLFCTLKSPAMRPRHWEELARLAKTSIALTTVSLEDVLKLRLYEHAQHVRDITNRAEREMKIEDDLIKLSAEWEDAKFDLRPLARESKETREKTLILCSVDDITLSLEDSSLTLQSMSASKHAAPFRDTVQSWEYNLAHISDVLEAWIGTQRKWMYLQSIFCGADDIRAQLPREADQFDQIDLAWREIMRSTQENLESKVLESCRVEGRLHHLKELSLQLES